MSSSNSSSSLTSVFQQKPEDAVKQFLMETLERKELPKGSLQDILKDGILLCELIKRFSPNECIIKNEGGTIFAYQDNIGQFLRVAESLHIPQSDLFQTVDLLEGKRMQSVISCLLAIKRIMSERKVIPTKPTSEFLTTGRKSGSRNSQLLLTPSSPPTAVPCNNNAYNVLQINKHGNSCRPVHQKRFSNSSFSDEKKLLPSPPTTPPTANTTAAQQYLLHTKAKSASALYIPTGSKNSSSPEWPKRSTNPRRSLEFTGDAKKTSLEKKFQQKSTSSGNRGGGYVKSQVHMITSNNHLAAVEPSMVKVKRHSASDNTNDMTHEKATVKAIPARSSPMPMPKPSKSTPLVAATNITVTAKTTATKKKTTAENKMKYYTDYNNRKTSLKKMGSCALTVESDDGTSAVYALGKSIGKGQFGEVFGGLNMDTGEYVAIKRIKRNQMECDDMNEVGVLKHLNSEHIVRYKGFSKDKEYMNIILEYVEMGSLHNNIKAFGKFPEKLAASYTYKILSGLHYLHSQDVIHCDLKAANILITKTGGLKLTDFGVSLSLKMKDDENTGEPAGTPNWMAPEVIKFAGASAKSDIWSLGCTIVEMLTGKPPYAGIPSFAALYRIVEDDEPPIPKNIALSDEAREFLLACFKKNPEDRPSAFDLMKMKWMETYFHQDPSFLSLPNDEIQTIKKSKSETCLESSTSSNDFLTHQFVDYQTYQKGEKCYGCNIQMKRLWVKSCQDCQLKFHPHCINKAPLCTKGYHINSTFIKSTIPDEKRKYTPLGPLNTNLTKAYLPVMNQQLHSDSVASRKYHQYKSEGYATSKNDTNRRNMVSSIMT
ncbi:Protein kinase of the Mitotic Exit Network [Mucor circinelloides]